jgi:hypothetical protein
MSNLSSAIIQARKRHEAEIAERLERRKQRQRAELERLNSATNGGGELPNDDANVSAPDETADATLNTALALATPPPTEPQPRPADAQIPQAGSANHIPPEQAHVAPHAVPPDTTAAEPIKQHEQNSQTIQRRVFNTLTSAPQHLSAEVHIEEVETAPDGRFLKVRNDIIDRIKPFLSGNQFAVYMEIYRQTIGRGRTSAWFRTRDIQTACNIGSDNTVRDAYPILERKRLIKLDPTRRNGSPRGLLITVLSVERALERLERGRSPAQKPNYLSTEAPPQKLPQYLSTNYLSTSAETAEVILNTWERHDLKTPPPSETAQAQPGGGGDLDLTESLRAKYGISPTAAPQLLARLGADDLALLPYLLRRLDQNIASGKVHNPAGLLRVWIESFDAWRPELSAARQRDEEALDLAREIQTKEELMLAWFKETEAHVQTRLETLDESAREAMRARGRQTLGALSPSASHWTPDQWESQLDSFVRSELRREMGPFEEWLAQRELPRSPHEGQS